jgi:hypothetical protein
MALLKDEHAVQRLAANRTYTQELPDISGHSSAGVRRVTRGRGETRIDALLRRTADGEAGRDER